MYNSLYPFEFAVLFYPIIWEYALLYYRYFFLLNSFSAFSHLWFSRYKYSNLFLSISICFLDIYLYLCSRSKEAKSFLNCYNAMVNECFTIQVMSWSIFCFYQRVNSCTHCVIIMITSHSIGQLLNLQFHTSWSSTTVH